MNVGKCSYSFLSFCQIKLNTNKVSNILIKKWSWQYGTGKGRSGSAESVVGTLLFSPTRVRWVHRLQGQHSTSWGPQLLWNIQSIKWSCSVVGLGSFSTLDTTATRSAHSHFLSFFPFIIFIRKFEHVFCWRNKIFLFTPQPRILLRNNYYIFFFLNEVPPHIIKFHDQLRRVVN